MRALVKLALSLALLFGFATLPASAVQTGTPAWTLKALTLMEGPGNAYDSTGQVEAESRVYVDRCSKTWCQISAGGQQGWVDLYALAFGQEAKPPLSGPRLNLGKGGGVCLYEGANFTGASICAGAGYVVSDLLLTRKDNVYSSVKIDGPGSVLLCRDRDFKSYCVRVNESQERLTGFLNNAVSSLRVY